MHASWQTPKAAPGAAPWASRARAELVCRQGGHWFRRVAGDQQDLIHGRVATAEFLLGCHLRRAIGPEHEGAGERLPQHQVRNQYGVHPCAQAILHAWRGRVAQSHGRGSKHGSVTAFHLAEASHHAPVIRHHLARPRGRVVEPLQIRRSGEHVDVRDFIDDEIARSPRAGDPPLGSKESGNADSLRGSVPACASRRARQSAPG